MHSHPQIAQLPHDNSVPSQNIPAERVGYIAGPGVHGPSTSLGRHQHSYPHRSSIQGPFEIRKVAGLLSTKALVAKDSEGLDAYHVNLDSDKASFVIHRANSNGPVIAIANARGKDSKQLEITLEDGSSTSLVRESSLGRTYKVAPPGTIALFPNLQQAQTTPPAIVRHNGLCWKGTNSHGVSKLSSRSFKLVDQQNNLFAVFSSSAETSLSKVGKLEILAKEVDQRSIDWIFTSCIVLERKQKEEDDGWVEAIFGVL